MKHGAKRMILMGECLQAERAYELGLVQEVVSQGTSLSVAKTWAQNLLKRSPDALLASKCLIQGARGAFPNQQLIHEREAFVRLFARDNQKEGVRAFLEKRPPVWSY